MSKFKTEIWNDFKIERHEDYTVIWPMRSYYNEEWDYKADKETESKIKNIMRYTDMIVRKWFPHLFKD